VAAPASLTAARFLQQSRQGIVFVLVGKLLQSVRGFGIFSLAHLEDQLIQSLLLPLKVALRSSSISSSGSCPSLSALRAANPARRLAFGPSLDFLVVIGNVQKARIFSSSSSSRQGFARKSSAPL
jgi:hypothetical protein